MQGFRLHFVRVFLHPFVFSLHFLVLFLLFARLPHLLLFLFQPVPFFLRYSLRVQLEALQKPIWLWLYVSLLRLYVSLLWLLFLPFRLPFRLFFSFRKGRQLSSPVPSLDVRVLVFEPLLSLDVRVLFVFEPFPIRPLLIYPVEPSFCICLHVFQ